MNNKKRNIIAGLALITLIGVGGTYSIVATANEGTPPANLVISKLSNEWKDEVSIKAQNTKVSLDQAKKIALDKVPGSTIKDFELEKEGNRYIFEIEVLKEREETEFKIDAESGEILSQEVENDQEEDEWKDEVSIEAQNTKISLDQAKKIALDKVPGSTIKDFELEKEGNRYIFEIEVLKGREETEFKIDAESGEILSQEVDKKWRY